MTDHSTRDPLVSIVIPTYNAADFLPQSIDSVLAQTYGRLELIVVDDGSTDGTPDILARYEGRLRAERQPNGGQSSALNRGWESSGGDLIGYLSADDRLRPEAVARLVDALRDAPRMVLAYPDFGLIDEESRPIHPVRAPDYSRERLIAGFQCLPGPGALFRRTAWRKAGGWDTGLRQMPDLDFFLRLCLAGPFMRVPEILADFRIHRRSTTYSPAPTGRADEPLRIVETFFSRPDLPAEIMAWRRRSRANALLLSGFIHGQSRRLPSMLKRWLAAFGQHPPALFSTRMLGYAKGIALPRFGTDP